MSGKQAKRARRAARGAEARDELEPKTKTETPESNGLVRDFIDAIGDPSIRKFCTREAHDNPEVFALLQRCEQIFRASPEYAEQQAAFGQFDDEEQLVQ